MTDLKDPLILHLYSSIENSFRLTHAKILFVGNSCWEIFRLTFFFNGVPSGLDYISVTGMFEALVLGKAHAGGRVVVVIGDG